MDRRSLIKSLGMMAGALALGEARVLGNVSYKVPTPKRALRIAHLTDIHISSDKTALNGYEKCLMHLQNLEEKPDFIINGGDTIEDALYRSRSQINEQWGAWHDINKMHSDLHMHYCIGNHDIWGLYSGRKDGDYGKRVALDMLRTASAYYSFDAGGWHIIILDSTQKKKNGLWYTAALDPVQFEWLKNDLKNTAANVPIMVVSHIPILCANVFLDDIKIRNGKFQIPGSWMHTDVKEIIGLFDQYPNVKLCLSGHIHMQDSVVYHGVSYCCNGAVCGDWWKHNIYNGTNAGYAIIDLFEDGSFSNTYMSYDS